jgi:hypothetical protein
MVNDVLDGHVALDIECLDRIYLNAYVPILQTSSQVVAFLSGHLGFPFPSPVLFRQLGDRFRKAVLSFSDANDIPWVKFGKDEAKLEVMQPHLARQASTGRSGVAAIGVAQEFQRVWTASEGKTSTGTPRWSFYKADRRVTCYYFYLWDAGFGPAFIKVCAWFPYPAKIWLNGHEWVKRQDAKAGLGFTALSNGFAACEDPPALQAICDRLGPGTINVFVQRWLHRLPLPFGVKDHDAGYWWELSMRQVEISRTIVFDAPRHARGFFEALVADNLDIGRPHNVEIIFARKIRRDTRGVFRTAIDRRDNGGVLVNVFYKHSRIKQYLKDGRAMRIETVVHAPRKAHTFEPTCARWCLKFTGWRAGCLGPGQPRRAGRRRGPCRGPRRRAWDPGWRRDRQAGSPAGFGFRCRPDPAPGPGTGPTPRCAGSWCEW